VALNQVVNTLYLSFLGSLKVVFVLKKFKENVATVNQCKSFEGFVGEVRKIVNVKLFKCLLEPRYADLEAAIFILLWHNSWI
jgi:hypothetical protein